MTRTKNHAGCEIIDGFAELALAVADRRHELGLNSDDVDHAAGLTHRHTQKIEDAGRRLANGETFSDHSALAMLLPLSDAKSMSAEGLALLKYLLESGVEKRVQPRIPQTDTILLLIQALGGSLRIEWADPPVVTKRFAGSHSS